MPVVTLHNRLKIKGTEFVREFKFKNGHSVPMFDILSMHGLNQIIGYAKFNNKDTANVYYRGECKIHDSLIPSIFRGCIRTSKAKDFTLLLKRFAYQ
jgi:hypothetical protein